MLKFDSWLGKFFMISTFSRLTKRKISIFASYASFWLAVLCTFPPNNLPPPMGLRLTALHGRQTRLAHEKGLRRCAVLAWEKVYTHTYTHNITLHYITFHNITLHYSTLQYITLQYITILHYSYITIHYIAIHYKTIHYITLH